MSRRGGTRPWSLLSPTRSRALAHGCSTRMSTVTTTAPSSPSSVTTARSRRGSSRVSTRRRRHVDLRTHDGVHPRVGAADVVPVVPLAAADLGRAVDVALVVGARVGDELGLPVFLYGEIGDGRRPAFFRRGGPGELQRRVDAGELEPAFGPRRLDPAAGAVLLGCARAARRVQPRAAWNARRRPRRCGCRARVVRRAARRPGARPAPRRRTDPGVDERRRPGRDSPARDGRAHRRGGRGAWGRCRGGGARRAAARSLCRGRRAGRGDRESARRPRRSGAGRRSTSPRGRCGSDVSTSTVWSSGISWRDRRGGRAGRRR